MNEEGKIIITWNHNRSQILAVTRQNEEGQILKVIADSRNNQAHAPAPDPNNPGWCIGCNPDNCEGCGNGLPIQAPAVGAEPMAREMLVSLIVGRLNRSGHGYQEALVRDVLRHADELSKPPVQYKETHNAQRNL